MTEGEYVPGTPASLYYGIDQIGSVRRVFASTTSAPAYGYDPYGLPLQVTAPLTDFVYAGMLYNADSGLYLANYRDDTICRGSMVVAGSSRRRTLTPLAISMPYVGGEPISLVDPTARTSIFAIAGGAASGAAVDVGAELLTNGGNLGCIDWGWVGQSAGLGAGITGSGIPPRSRSSRMGCTSGTQGADCRYGLRKCSSRPRQSESAT